MKYLKVKEVAGILNISYRKVLDQIHMGNLIAIKIDSIYRIDESALRAFIESAQVNSVWK
jgi:excisionase family DNA binding protein